MEPQQVIHQFLHLPVDAQRLVADLVAYLDRLVAEKKPVLIGTNASNSTAGATLLPPLNLDEIPTTWPENSFMNPEFFGAWADRDDIIDSTEYVRQLRREQWGAKS